MRPRVFPAEDAQGHRIPPAPDHASMRPRVFPAEDVAAPPAPYILTPASMRPRVFPAEDTYVLLRPKQVRELQ